MGNVELSPRTASGISQDGKITADRLQNAYDSRKTVDTPQGSMFMNDEGDRWCLRINDDHTPHQRHFTEYRFSKGGELLSTESNIWIIPQLKSPEDLSLDTVLKPATAPITGTEAFRLFESTPANPAPPKAVGEKFFAADSASPANTLLCDSTLAATSALCVARTVAAKAELMEHLITSGEIYNENNPGVQDLKTALIRDFGANPEIPWTLSLERSIENRNLMMTASLEDPNSSTVYSAKLNPQSGDVEVFRP